jgi:radical SAM superfamily enzyme
MRNNISQNWKSSTVPQELAIFTPICFYCSHSSALLNSVKKSLKITAVNGNNLHMKQEMNSRKYFAYLSFYFTHDFNNRLANKFVILSNIL